MVCLLVNKNKNNVVNEIVNAIVKNGILRYNYI